LHSDHWGIYTLELVLDLLSGERPEVFTLILALLLLDYLLDLFDVVFDLGGSEFGFFCHGFILHV